MNDRIKYGMTRRRELLDADGDAQTHHNMGWIARRDGEKRSCPDFSEGRTAKGTEWCEREWYGGWDERKKRNAHKKRSGT